MTTPDLPVGTRVDRYVVEGVARVGPHAVYDVQHVVGARHQRLCLWHTEDRGCRARAVRAARTLLDPIDVIEVDAGVGVLVDADADVAAADALWAHAATPPADLPEPLRVPPHAAGPEAPAPGGPRPLPAHVLAHRQTVRGVLIFVIATLLMWGVARLLRQPRSPWIEPIPTDTL